MGASGGGASETLSHTIIVKEGTIFISKSTWRLRDMIKPLEALNHTHQPIIKRDKITTTIYYIQ
ncbi:hypothetical protein HanPSC8_Chr14g0629571 [Helianthus annuus]|nr:hypothetical protein HanPSC8_Chr14g0629571 [Helianthus annuus]